MNVGENIKRIRKSKHFSQEELATACGLSKNGLWNYENNKRQANIEVLKDISNALDVSVNEILGENQSDVEVAQKIVDQQYDFKVKELKDYTTEELLEEIKRRIEKNK